MSLARPITPHLWFDTQAFEAADFYRSVFPGSRVTSVTTLHGTPSGDCDVVAFELHGQPLMAISAGPMFRFNPSVSFIVNFDPSRERDAGARLDRTWAALVEGGEALLPLDEYPFSKRYGWVQDRNGPAPPAAGPRHGAGPTAIDGLSRPRSCRASPPSDPGSCRRTRTGRRPGWR